MNVQEGTIDYSEVLRDLTERRNELDAAIRAIRRIVGIPLAASSPGVAPVSLAGIRAALDRNESSA